MKKGKGKKIMVEENLLEPILEQISRLEPGRSEDLRLRESDLVVALRPELTELRERVSTVSELARILESFIHEIRPETKTMRFANNIRLLLTDFLYTEHTPPPGWARRLFHPTDVAEVRKLLVMEIEKRPKILSMDELVEKLWPDICKQLGRGVAASKITEVIATASRVSKSSVASAIKRKQSERDHQTEILKEIERIGDARNEKYE